MRRTFSVSIYVVHSDAVLLIQHRRLGIWLPIGGEVEVNETPLEAARRELHEETGMVAEFDLPPALPIPGTPPSLLGYEEHDAGVKGLHLNFMFVARAPVRQITGDGSFGQHRWVTEAPADSPPNVCAGVRMALEAARRA